MDDLQKSYKKRIVIPIYVIYCLPPTYAEYLKFAFLTIVALLWLSVTIGFVNIYRMQ